MWPGQVSSPEPLALASDRLPTVLQSQDFYEQIRKFIPKLTLTLLHSERPKLYTILAFLGAIGLTSPHSPATQLISSSSDRQYGYLNNFSPLWFIFMVIYHRLVFRNALTATTACVYHILTKKYTL